MAQKLRPQAETLSGLPQPNFSGYSPAPIIAKRDPTTSDTGYPLMQLWDNKLTNKVFALGSVAAGSASWSELGGGADTYPISPYVVGPTGNAGYQTIQSAITAAQAAGGGTIYVQPGTYTENLVLANAVNIIGTVFSNTTINGVHTPPSSGSITFQNLTLTSATHIFSSAAAGSASIAIEDCVLSVTNGYVFNLANWTGTLLIDDCGSTSTNDGVVNNTSGATVKITSATLGAGTGNTFTYSGGSLTLEAVVLNCPATLGTGASLTARQATTFTNTLTTANNSTATITGCYFSTGSAAAISHGSSGTMTISTTTITSSNTNAIAGAGSGILTLSGVSFTGSSGIAGTLTVASGLSRGGNYISQYVVGPAPDAKYQTIQAAITAAAAAGGSATVFVKPGTYTENLTLSANIDIRGEVFSGVTITGVHTPPASGSLTLQNCTLTSATHIFSSAAAGSASIAIEDCVLSVTNGYVFNLANWTGTLLIDDCGSTSTNDGVVNNTGGATVKITSATLGAGTGNTFTYSGGSLTLEAVVLNCPATLGTGASLTARQATTFTNTLTTANNSTATITGCYFSTGSTAAISHGSSGSFLVSSCVITSSNNPAISGAGAGTLTLTGVNFTSNAAIAGTLTVAYGTTTTGALNANGATSIASGTGAINISADAAATTVNIGTGSAAKTVNLGSASGASSTTIECGTGGILIGTGASAHITTLGSNNTTSTTNIMSGSGGISITSGTGIINISTDAANTNTFIGTGAGVKGVTIGSTNTSSATAIQSGTGGITVATGATAGNIAMTPATNSVAGTTITLNARLGQATFTGQTTASGSSQAFTINNTSVSGTTQSVIVSADNLGSNDAQMSITRVLQAAGVLTVTLKNNGAAALNGDVHITFHVLN